MRGALSFGVGLAVAQSGMNLPDSSYPIGDELTVAQSGLNLSGGRCPTGDELKGCGCLCYHSSRIFPPRNTQTEDSE